MSLFEEVNNLLDTEKDKMAHDTYNSLLDLQRENYGFYEINEVFFGNTHSNLDKYLKKIKETIAKNTRNIENFKNAYDFGSMLSVKEKFKLLSIDKFYKGQNKLPKWFDEYKMEQLERAREYINNFALRSYKNRVNETVMAERKRLEKKVLNLIDEIHTSYTVELKLEPPILKIQELQHLLEEMQEYDRIISELVIVVMHKVDEACAQIVRNFLEFQSKCETLFK
ncbi:unnamed protein product (macronuclear) [Paramecium tetraurelia]|uniref:BAR domain-containing protein n=1 Tax=Paramecium tetraurelia TaxID=5888 RepID=A0CQ93_PARTE|nr:uncharacterized protein GSPATT00009308001 [Paramecium tetraurelia]CAK72960.1 unnamed protein product [Paramecium tetraurelia]|eukprot:XP_001440357.1 hypothetical protein (macronuclear) [Paramecium tetraurelia strain d4-2]